MSWLVAFANDVIMMRLICRVLFKHKYKWKWQNRHFFSLRRRTNNNNMIQNNLITLMVTSVKSYFIRLYQNVMLQAGRNMERTSILNLHPGPFLLWGNSAKIALTEARHWVWLSLGNKQSWQSSQMETLPVIPQALRDSYRLIRTHVQRGWGRNETCKVTLLTVYPRRHLVVPSKRGRLALSWTTNTIWMLNEWLNVVPSALRFLLWMLVPIEFWF